MCINSFSNYPKTCCNCIHWLLVAWQLHIYFRKSLMWSVIICFAPFTYIEIAYPTHLHHTHWFDIYFECLPKYLACFFIFCLNLHINFGDQYFWGINSLHQHIDRYPGNQTFFCPFFSYFDISFCYLCTFDAEFLTFLCKEVYRMKAYFRNKNSLISI